MVSGSRERVPEEVIVPPRSPPLVATEVTVPPELVSVSTSLPHPTIPADEIELTFCVPEQDWVLPPFMFKLIVPDPVIVPPVNPVDVATEVTVPEPLAGQDSLHCPLIHNPVVALTNFAVM